MTMPPSKRIFLVAPVPLAVFLFVATSINLSWVQSLHNSDSLLVSLISIDRYTPFYWSQNRYGQFFPLIASFVSNYTTNLFVQTELLVCSSLGCIVLFNLYFLHKTLGAAQRLAVAAISAALSVCVLSSRETAAHMLAIGAQPYMPSLFLLLLALALLYRVEGVGIPVRLAGSLVCLLIAFWMNISIAPLAAGLIVCVGLGPPRSRVKLHLAARLAPELRLVALAVLGIALAANVWFARRHPGDTYLVFTPARLWLAGLQSMTQGTVSYFFHPWRLSALSILCAVAVLLQLAWREVSRHYRVADALVFLSAALGFAAAIGRLEWVRMSEYSPRYWTISLMLLLFLGTGWLGSAILRLLTRAAGPRAALVCSGSLLVALVLSVFGFPSYAKADAFLGEGIDRYEKDARALGCTHFVGSYWAGWVMEFRRETSGGPPLWAITFRSEMTRDRWDWNSSRPRTYCGIPGDPDMELFRRGFGLPHLRESTRSGSLCKLEPVPGA